MNPSTQINSYRVDAFADPAGKQRIASETIEADGADTALHVMSERYPQAAIYAAVATRPIYRLKLVGEVTTECEDNEEEPHEHC